MHGTKCSGTEQNILVREPSVLACRIPPAQVMHQIYYDAYAFLCVVVSTFPPLREYQREVQVTSYLPFYWLAGSCRDIILYGGGVHGGVPIPTTGEKT